MAATTVIGVLLAKTAKKRAEKAKEKAILDSTKDKFANQINDARDFKKFFERHC